ncbi:MAG: hypothetical protein QOI95_593 [Acidimicrobiaceae bacterium]|jgi:hypothetical membrane protein
MVWAGVVGPVGFVAAWVIAGARTNGYSPVDDAISLLAARDAPTRWLMTAGFACFGVGVPVFALVLRSALPGRAWLAAVVSGVATLGVAAFPLHVSVTIDRLHGTFATVGYVSLALVPLLAARPLSRRGRGGAATASIVVAAISAACLAATPFTASNGVFQRAGLTVVDAWLVVTAMVITKLRQRTPPAVADQRKNDRSAAR